MGVVMSVFMAPLTLAFKAIGVTKVRVLFCLACANETHLKDIHLIYMYHYEI